MSNILILGKPGSGKTTYLSNLYGIYNEKHIFDKNPSQLEDFSIRFDATDAVSLKQNYKLIKGKKDVQATIAYQDFKCQLCEGKESVYKFNLCDNRGGITRQMDWGNHMDWIKKLAELISHDTNGADSYSFDAVLFFYDCTEFKESGELFSDVAQVKKQLAILDDVAKKADKPVFLIFTKKDMVDREEINQIDEIFTDAQKSDSYLNKIFLQLNDASPKNRGKIAVPALYILRKLYSKTDNYDYDQEDRLRKYCMHISNL